MSSANLPTRQLMLSRLSAAADREKGAILLVLDLEGKLEDARRDLAAVSTETAKIIAETTAWLAEK